MYINKQIYIISYGIKLFLRFRYLYIILIASLDTEKYLPIFWALYNNILISNRM